MVNRIKLFFRKWFSGDEKINFFAAIFSALTVSVETQDPNKINSYKEFAEALSLNHHDTDVFKERVAQYKNSYAKEEIRLNDLINKINKISKVHPEWIIEIPLEALIVCISPDEILQKRVLEFLLTLLQESSH